MLKADDKERVNMALRIGAVAEDDKFKAENHAFVLHVSAKQRKREKIAKERKGKAGKETTEKATLDSAKVLARFEEQVNKMEADAEVGAKEGAIVSVQHRYRQV